MGTHRNLGHINFDVGQVLLFGDTMQVKWLKSGLVINQGAIF